MAKQVRIRLTIGHGPKNKPIIKNFYGKTKKECSEKIKAYHLSMANQNDIEETLFQIWADKWLNVYKEGSVSDTTYYSYKLCIDHLNKYFEDCFVHTIRAVDIQEFFNEKSHLSQSMINKLKITLNSIFQTAIENELAIKNPMTNLGQPKGQTTAKKRTFTVDEYKKVIAFAKQHKEGLGPYIILKTGLRKGELMGINPERDIDFENKRLSVSHVVTDVNGTPILKDTGKSKNALRTIPFDDDFYSFLKDDPRLNKNDHLFKTKYKKLMGPRSWARHHYSVFLSDLKAKHPEIPQLAPHELRHTYGTLLYKAGTDVFTLQKLLGHASIETTTKIYVHDDITDVEKNIKRPE
jgi:integrase